MGFTLRPLAKLPCLAELATLCWVALAFAIVCFVLGQSRDFERLEHTQHFVSANKKPCHWTWLSLFGLETEMVSPTVISWLCRHHEGREFCRGRL